MIQKTHTTKKPNLEEIRKRFETWRKSTTGRKVIPDELWDAAAGLCDRYSISHISEILSLNYTQLKKRTCPPKNDLPTQQPTSAFIELEMARPSSCSKITIEMNDRNGAAMKIELSGNNPIDVYELCNAFWRKE